MDNNKIGRFVFILLVGFAVVPILIYLGVDQIDLISSNIDSATWLSFWGTYCGACIGGMATFISLVTTLKYYQNEAKEKLEQIKKDNRISEKRHREEIIRKQITESRPYITFEEKNVYNDTKIVDVNRYVYESDEENYADLNNYEDDDVKSFEFIVKNIGNGPAENVNVIYQSSIYCIDGFNDIVIGNVNDSPKFYHKMSIDIMEKQEITIKLFLHFSKKMKDSTYKDDITVSFEFADIRHNRIQRNLSINLRNQYIIGWSEQVYIDGNVQNIFIGNDSKALSVFDT